MNAGLLDQIRFTVIIILAVLATIQLLYWIFLALPLGREPRPQDPNMPTNPQGVLQGPGSGASNVNTSEIAGKMVVISGLPGVNEIPLPSSAFGIGRFYNPDQDILIALDERSISRRHAVFSTGASRGEYYISDTGSSYGTIVRKDNNSKKLSAGEQERIYNGDIVQFGNVVTVRFMLPGETRASVTRI